MKRSGSLLVFLLLAALVSAQDKNRRNFSWTFDQKNDPILQVKNESVDPVRVEVRLLFQDDSYRYPEDIEVPSGESRFLRIREALDRLSRRYGDLASMSSGIVQIQFVGDNQQIESTIVNLNPKMGVTIRQISRTRSTGDSLRGTPVRTAFRWNSCNDSR